MIGERPSNERKSEGHQVVMKENKRDREGRRIERERERE